jgi:hypothetical protein
MKFEELLRFFGVRSTQPRRSSSGVVAPTFTRGSLNYIRFI